MTSAVAFTHELRFEDLPPEVVAEAKRCLLDLIGVAAAGALTPLSSIIRDHAADQFAAGRSAARLWFDGRAVSPSGAAMANGMSIDSVDAHDGHPVTKGHIGCGALPALVGFCETSPAPLDGRDFLTALTLGYEIGARAGMALHRTVSDYHTSGAWVALVCAALGARLMRLDHEQTRHAIGIAEYHGPRSQMMRCIDHPSMLKDGSGWGAMAGVSAAHLAATGFTGAPALTLEQSEVADLWADLGGRWRIREQYFKPYPVCRWAQPPTDAALGLMRAHELTSADIERVEVTTFHEATRLAMRRPSNTEEAQYSLPFPVAAAIRHGGLGPEHIRGDALHDAETLRLSDSVVLAEGEVYNSEFPAVRRAHVVLVLRDGTELRSEPMAARGDATSRLTDAEVSAKFQTYATPTVGAARAGRIEALVAGLDAPDAALAPLLDAIAAPGDG